MPNWKRLVKDFFKMSDPEGAYEHYAGPGASHDEIASLQSALGFTFPGEFRDLYSHFNGIGLVDREATESSPLFFRPISEIASFTSECRSWISETHPREAEHYFPFIDWSSGDSSGYWPGTDGKLESSICTFSHERYRGIPDQNPEDFIQPHFRNIADLLSPG